MLAKVLLYLLLLATFVVVIAISFHAYQFGLRHFVNGFTARTDIIDVTEMHISIHKIYDTQNICAMLSKHRSHSRSFVLTAVIFLKISFFALNITIFNGCGWKVLYHPSATEYPSTTNKFVSKKFLRHAPNLFIPSV